MVAQVGGQTNGDPTTAAAAPVSDPWRIVDAVDARAWEERWGFEGKQRLLKALHARHRGYASALGWRHERFIDVRERSDFGLIADIKWGVGFIAIRGEKWREHLRWVCRDYKDGYLTNRRDLEVPLGPIDACSAHDPQTDCELPWGHVLNYAGDVAHGPWPSYAHYFAGERGRHVARWVFELFASGHSHGVTLATTAPQGMYPDGYADTRVTFAALEQAGWIRRSKKSAPRGYDGYPEKRAASAKSDDYGNYNLAFYFYEPVRENAEALALCRAYVEIIRLELGAGEAALEAAE